ncbi:protein of unknown function [Streptomyces sp. KY75]|nr:protein of unknown function [Streptomyces sp. KY75]CAD5987650.1 protein of unknown function [Streptomyces sp. KY70]
MKGLGRRNDAQAEPLSMLIGPPKE